MNTALIFAALRTRAHLLVGALAIALIVRGGHLAYGTLDWDQSPASFGIWAAVMALLLPSFAALMGSDLCHSDHPELAFELARPVARRRLFHSRLMADAGVLVLCVLAFVLIAPMGPNERLPLPVLATFVGLWVGIYGAAAAGGAVGLRPVSAVTAAAALLCAAAVGAFLATTVAVETAGYKSAEVAIFLGPPNAADGAGVRLAGLYLWMGFIAAQGVALLLGLFGWGVARRAYDQAPIHLERRSTARRIGVAAAAAIALATVIVVGSSYVVGPMG